MAYASPRRPYPPIVLLILLSILAGTGSSQLLPPDRALPAYAAGTGAAECMGMPRCGLPPMGVPMELVLGGRGFAFRDNETHLFRLNVERFMPIEPGEIRDLLASNKSVEEIREAIKAEDGTDSYRGFIWLDRIPYHLTDISIHPFGDNATVTDANLVLPGYESENQSENAGHLVMTVYPSAEGAIGEGRLNISTIEDNASYRVLLDMPVRATPFGADRGRIYAHENFLQSVVAHLMGFIHRLLVLI